MTPQSPVLRCTPSPLSGAQRPARRCLPRSGLDPPPQRKLRLSDTRFLNFTPFYPENYCPYHSPCLFPFNVRRRGVFLLSKAIGPSLLSPLRLASLITSQICLHVFLLHWLLLLSKHAQLSSSYNGMKRKNI